MANKKKLIIRLVLTFFLFLLTLCTIGLTAYGLTHIIKSWPTSTSTVPLCVETSKTNQTSEYCFVPRNNYTNDCTVKFTNLTTFKTDKSGISQVVIAMVVFHVVSVVFIFCSGAWNVSRKVSLFLCHCICRRDESEDPEALWTRHKKKTALRLCCLCCDASILILNLIFTGIVLYLVFGHPNVSLSDYQVITYVNDPVPLRTSNDLSSCTVSYYNNTCGLTESKYELYKPYTNHSVVNGQELLGVAYNITKSGCELATDFQSEVRENARDTGLLGIPFIIIDILTVTISFILLITGKHNLCRPSLHGRDDSDTDL